jgi:hypothetical protein
LNSTSTAALPTPTHPNPPTNQLAHLAAVAAATTQNANAGSIPSNLNSATSSTAQQSVQQQSGATQHQQTLNALNQLGLGATTTEEQVEINGNEWKGECPFAEVNSISQFFYK